MLAGVVPPNIGRDVYARMEITQQMEQKTHSLFGHIPARCHLKSRKDFLISVEPSYFPPKAVQCNAEEIKGQVALRNSRLQCRTS